MRDKEEGPEGRMQHRKMQACPEGGALGQELQRRGQESEDSRKKVVRFCDNLNERGRQVMEERRGK